MQESRAGWSGGAYSKLTLNEGRGSCQQTLCWNASRSYALRASRHPGWSYSHAAVTLLVLCLTSSPKRSRLPRAASMRCSPLRSWLTRPSIDMWSGAQTHFATLVMLSEPGQQLPCNFQLTNKQARDSAFDHGKRSMQCNALFISDDDV